MPKIRTTATLKTTREALCAAQATLRYVYKGDTLGLQQQVLQRLIDDIDRQRPLGPDGKHGNRHTETCGCIDKPIQYPHAVLKQSFREGKAAAKGELIGTFGEPERDYTVGDLAEMSKMVEQSDRIVSIEPVEERTRPTYNEGIEDAARRAELFGAHSIAGYIRALTMEI